jgi:hypothetical protein
MVGVILAGIALGAATLVILKGRKSPQAQPVRVKDKDRTHAQDR